jgi:hypothetical protein
VLLQVCGHAASQNAKDDETDFHFHIVPCSGSDLRKFHFLVMLAFDVHDLLRRQ